MAEDGKRVSAEQEEGVWRVERGSPARRPRIRTYRADGRENLTYNNPHALEIERVWFDGKVIFAVEQGEVELEFDEQRVCRNNKVAREYQVVYRVDLDERGKLNGEPERVHGQYNIYDSVPGMDRYSPLWQFYYVVAPRDYEPNALRSEADCLSSGYPIVTSTVVEN
jgi:hypothetical protein